MHRGKVENKLHNTVQQLENIIALLPGHVYWKNCDGVLLGCNNEQAQDIGLKSRHEVVGLTAYDTLPADLADAITLADQEVMESRLPKTVREILKLPNGKKSIWLSRKVPLFEDGKLIGLLGVSLDITEFERTKHKLREVEHRLEAMTAVSASIAHELRTPLASIRFGVHGIQKYLPDIIEGYKLAQSANLPVKAISQSRMDLLETVLRTLDNEMKAANNFIDMLLVKIQPAVSAKSSATFSMVHCIQEALDRYPFQGEQRNWIHFSDKPDFEVMGDTLMMIHVLFNLLKNALYYVAAKGKSGNIMISLECGKRYNKLYFRDTGTGIPEAVLPKIFDRFYSKTQHGAGVGLTFCKMVLRSLGGKIQCKSVEGEYTLFILSLPIVSTTTRGDPS